MPWGTRRHGDHAPCPPQVVDADRDGPGGQLRRDERTGRIEGMDDQVADGAAGREPARARPCRGRRIGRGTRRRRRRRRASRRSRRSRGRGRRTARPSRPVRVHAAARSGARRSRRTSGRRWGGRCRQPVGEDARQLAGIPSRSSRDELPANWTTDVRSSRRGEMARTTAASVEPQAMPIASPSPIRPSRTAPASRGTSVDADGGCATATAHRSSPNRSSIAPASSRSSAGTSRYSIGRDRQRGRHRSGGRRGTARTQGGMRSRPCSAGDRRTASRPGSKGPAPGRRWATCIDGRPRPSEMQPLICARIPSHTHP